MTQQTFYAYETLRPDQLEAVVRERPIAYWPLGLIEHHGWHLPIGFDGIKAHRLCERFAGHTGGVVLPVMWWGGGGGHGGFKWTHYQDEESAGAIAYRTVERLVAFGFRVVVLLCGHYPWEGILNRVGIQHAATTFPEARIIYGTEVTIAQEASGVPAGDHAARQETNYGLHLLPEFVGSTTAPRERACNAWPPEGEPTDLARFPSLHVDPADRRYAQLGDDPEGSGAEEGERHTAAIVEAVVDMVNAALVFRSTDETPSASEGS